MVTLLSHLVTRRPVRAGNATLRSCPSEAKSLVPVRRSTTPDYRGDQYRLGVSAQPPELKLATQKSVGELTERCSTLVPQGETVRLAWPVRKGTGSHPLPRDSLLAQKGKLKLGPETVRVVRRYWPLVAATTV